jgi:BlaI family transcriptional regulator, penicillinase repressor
VPRLEGQLGPLERAVMDVIWSNEEDVTVRVALETLADRKLAYTTVLTVFDRLWRKGFLRRRRIGRAYVYGAAISREAYLGGLVNQVLEATDHPRSVLLGFVRAADPNVLDDLRRVIREVDRERRPRT